MLFFFNDTATTEIYTLSLHDALPISIFIDFSLLYTAALKVEAAKNIMTSGYALGTHFIPVINLNDDAELKRSEEHTSELQSHLNLVCRLLLEKKKKNLS